ncbi:MAG TPA: FAD-dependent monooxygenase [Pseudonocardiaceae bacterium]|jgi:2-polyprenyl-6-methoxyphenol hydroxylase-like FAD-dependent oxidoreductase
MARERVLVVGGGIAGLSCAIAMGNHGHTVDVVELAGHVESESVNLNGRPVDALADLGVLSECCARANAQTGPVFGNLFDAAGRPRHLRSRPQEPHSTLPAAIVIHRPDLIDVLTDAAGKAGATIRMPATVTSIVQVPESVLVSFDDGSTGEYDLVVGADGLHSTVRHLVWGDGVRPVYSGALGLRWIAGTVPRGQQGFYYAPGKVVVVGELPGGRVYLASFADADEVDVTQAQARDLLRGVLAAFTAPYLMELRDRLDETQRIVTRPWESFWLPNWFQGRVVLIGDAAHATGPYLPAGGGMALIDSVVLAEELAESDTIADGLAAFLRRRADRARLVVETSIEVTRLRQEDDPRADDVVMAALRTLAQPY